MAVVRVDGVAAGGAVVAHSNSANQSGAPVYSAQQRL
jgi:hypothetical protein